MIPPLQEAKDAGIKIMTSTATWPTRAIGVQHPVRQPRGRPARRSSAMAKLIGGKGSVSRSTTTAGFPISEQRAQGLQRRDREVPGIKYLGVQYSNNERRRRPRTSCPRRRGSNPDLVGVYTAETNNTEGAITGVREAKKDGKI